MYTWRQRAQFLVLSTLITSFSTCIGQSTTDENLWVIQRHDNTTTSLFQTRPQSDVHKWISMFQFQQDTNAIRTILEKFRLPKHEEQEAYITLGDSLMAQSQFDSAKTAYHAAATVSRQHVQPPVRHITMSQSQDVRYAGSVRTAHAHFCLGAALIQVGDFAEAAASFKRSISLAPSFFLPIYYLGSLSILTGNVEDGLHFYRSAELLLDRLTPDAQERSYNSATQLPRRFFRHLTQIFKTQAMNLPMSQLKTDLSQLVRHYHMLDLSNLHIQLAMMLLNFGAFEEAMRHIQLVSGTGKDVVWLQAYSVFSTPVVFDGPRHAFAHRARLVERVRQALHERHSLGDPAQLHDLGNLFYALGFFGVPSHRLMMDISLMFALGVPDNVSLAPWLEDHSMQTRSMKQLQVGFVGLRDEFSRRVVEPVRASQHQPNATRLKQRKQAPGSMRTVRPRIGIISYKLFNHPMGWLISNIVQTLGSYKRRELPRGAEPGALPAVGGAGQHAAGLDRVLERVESFNVTVFRLNPSRDSLTSVILKAADTVIDAWPERSRNRNSTYLQQLISAEKLDALIVFDEGYDPLLYGVLQARMAPVQAVYRSAAGHMQSSGMPNTVDFWITGDDNTPSGAQSWMNEQLVRVGSVGDHMTWTAPPSPGQHLRVASKYRLMQQNTHYLIASGLESISSAMDRMIAEVLMLDPVSLVLILHEGGQELWAHKLKTRLGKRLQEQQIAVSRIKLIRSGSLQELPSLMNAVSAVLDTFPVGLGHLAFKSLAVGTPVISCFKCAQYSHTTAQALIKQANYSRFIAKEASGMAALAVDVVSAWKLESRAALRHAACTRLAWKDPLIVPKCTQVDMTAYSEAEQGTIPNQRSGALVDWAKLLGRATVPWARMRHQASSRRAQRQRNSN